jgi:hypothetical protein
MILPRRHCDFMMFTSAIDRLPIRAGHLAADHGHGTTGLNDSAVDDDFGAWGARLGEMMNDVRK